MVTWLVSSDTLPSEPPPMPDDGIDLLAAGCILVGASPPPNSRKFRLYLRQILIDLLDHFVIPQE